VRSWPTKLVCALDVMTSNKYQIHPIYIMMTVLRLSRRPTTFFINNYRQEAQLLLRQHC